MLVGGKDVVGSFEEKAVGADVKREIVARAKGVKHPQIKNRQALIPVNLILRQNDKASKRLINRFLIRTKP